VIRAQPTIHPPSRRFILREMVMFIVTILKVAQLSAQLFSITFIDELGIGDDAAPVHGHTILLSSVLRLQLFAWTEPTFPTMPAL